MKEYSIGRNEEVIATDLPLVEWQRFPKGGARIVLKSLGEIQQSEDELSLKVEIEVFKALNLALQISRYEKISNGCLSLALKRQAGILRENSLENIAERIECVASEVTAIIKPRKKS